MIISNASYAQRREYMLYRLRDDHYPFNMQQHFTITNFEIDRFQNFIDFIIKRHEILRTTLVLHGNILKQIIHDPEKFKVKYQYFDLKPLDDKAQEDFVKKQKAFQKCLSFNFELGPMFRIIVFSITNTLHVVLITGHHVVFDDYSFKIFNRDLQLFMSETDRTLTKPIYPDMTQYRFFAEWEERLIQSEDGRRYKEYFLNEMRSGIPKFEIIPVERRELRDRLYLERIAEVRKKMESIKHIDLNVLAPVVRRISGEDGGLITSYFDLEIKEGLWNLSRDQNISLSSLFIGFFIKMLNNASGQIGFAVDVPVSHRYSKTYQNTIGWLAMQGLCFLKITDDMDLCQISKYVNERLFDLYENSIFPSELIGSHETPVVGGDMPFFFNLSYIDGRLENVKLDECIYTDYGATCHQQLALFISVYDNAISVDLSYNNLLFDIAQMKQLTAEYNGLLRLYASSHLTLLKANL